MRLIPFMLCMALISGCANFNARETPDYSQLEQPIPDYIARIDAILTLNNPGLPLVTLHNHPARVTNAFVVKYPTDGSYHMFLMQGIVLAPYDDFIATVIGHEYGHVIAGHLEPEHAFTGNTPLWMQKESDEIGMYLAWNAGYDPCALQYATSDETRVEFIKEYCAELNSR